MIVGTREVRWEKESGVRLPRVNGVDERLGGSAGSVLTAVAGKIARASGLGEHPANPRFSCISVVISAVLAVLYFAPV